MNSYTDQKVYRSDRESLRLEAVTTCVGFDDMLDVSLERNHPHFDTIIVVTSHSDRKTRLCCQKYGVTCVESDLFEKNGRTFNKGAAINAGFDYFQYFGWRVHMDSDIVLADNFRRVLFNHTHLNTSHIYGIDRMDVVGKKNIKKFLNNKDPQATNWKVGTDHGVLSGRYVDTLRGYVPIGFFQLWHESCQKPYPHSLGTAAHDDVMFASLWPKHCRTHLPTVIAYHLCGSEPKIGENWDGKRKQKRID